MSKMELKVNGRSHSVDVDSATGFAGIVDSLDVSDWQPT